MQVSRLYPMLATAGELPVGPGWAYEFKWDGVRAVAVIARDGRLRLYARSGAEITAAYPELAPLGAAVTAAEPAAGAGPGAVPVAGAEPAAVLDGEIVLLDRAGRPSFTALAERMHVRDPARAARLAAARPVTYMVFDLLVLAGAELTGQPYRYRRERLVELGLAGPYWQTPPAFADGPATWAASGDLGLEGVVAKRLDSTYRPGLRSTDWIKRKRDTTADFVVGGYRPGKRRLGALLVGVPVTGGVLAFRGRVGGGISVAAERELLDLLAPLRADRPPFADPLPRDDARGAVWVRPELVVELRYGQRTPDLRLRFPRFVRIRTDKPPAEVADE